MQQVWRKRWSNTGWFALGAVTLVLLVAAIQKKNHKVCSGVEISFNRDGNNFFVDEKGVTATLQTFGPLKGEPIENINLKVLEHRLKADRWIADAELFFDNKQVLQVIVEEKEPVARVFTVDGGSFYIDSACNKLPLSEKLSARIPMFTNFPSGRSFLSRPDSQLLASVKGLAMFIQDDDFWKAQVAQVDITPNGFEMIPTIGSHIVALGKDGQWQQKFNRLFSFYKQVWTQVGFEKYEKLDIQFEDQVVATAKGAKSVKIDSAKARMAYESLLEKVKMASTVPNSFAANSSKKNFGKIAPAEAARPNAFRNNVETGKKLPAEKIVVQTVMNNKAKVKTEMAKTGTESAGKQVAKPLGVRQIASGRAVDEKKIPKAVMKNSITAKGDLKKGKK